VKPRALVTLIADCLSRRKAPILLSFLLVALFPELSYAASYPTATIKKIRAIDNGVMWIYVNEDLGPLLQQAEQCSADGTYTNVLMFSFSANVAILEAQKAMVSIMLYAAANQQPVSFRLDGCYSAGNGGAKITSVIGNY